MADNKRNSRSYSAQDRFITEIDRLLAITAAKPRSFAQRQPNSDQARCERARSLRSHHLRASHSNATAALGLRRGLSLAARSASAQKSADASEQQALAAQASIERELAASSLTAGVTAGAGYAAGLALGLSSRLFGDETGRKLSGSLNQLAVKTQSRRAHQLSKIDPDLMRSLNQQAASQTCVCGPHGHRTRSTIATRVLSKSANLLERLSRF